MRLQDWLAAIAIILALAFVYGYVDGTIEIHHHKQESK